MAGSFLILLGAFSLLDCFAIWKAHRADTLSQLLEWVLPDNNHPGMGIFYTVFGLGLIIVARSNPAPLYIPCYIIGGIMSFIGIRFFEEGFARRFLEMWIVQAEEKKRLWLPCITEGIIGFYLTFAGFYMFLPDSAAT